MENIYVAGIAMTVFGRHPERSLVSSVILWAIKPSSRSVLTSQCVANRF